MPLQLSLRAGVAVAEAADGSGDGSLTVPSDPHVSRLAGAAPASPTTGALDPGGGGGHSPPATPHDRQMTVDGTRLQATP